MTPVFTRLGRPNDPKDYTFEDPKDFQFSDADKEYRESFRPVAHRLGLSSRQVKGLHDWQIQQAKVLRDAERASRAEGSKKARRELEREWGRDFGSRLSKANSALTHYAGRDARALAQPKLEGGGVLGDRLEFVRMMSNISSAASAPTEPGTAAEPRDQIEVIQAAALQAGLDPQHRDWPHKKLDRLYAKAYGTKPLRTDGLHDD